MRSRNGELSYSNFLTVWTVKRPILHNNAKFRVDRSIRCCDIAFFVVFQDGGRRHIGFWKNRNFNGLSPVWGQFASLCQISSKSVKRLLRYGDLTVFFQNGGRPPSWISLARIGTTHEDYLSNGGLYRCAKFGWNRRSTFDNMKVLIFCAFGLKTPIHARKIGVLGDFIPL